MSTALGIRGPVRCAAAQASGSRVAVRPVAFLKPAPLLASPRIHNAAQRAPRLPLRVVAATGGASSASNYPVNPLTGDRVAPSTPGSGSAPGTPGSGGAYGTPSTTNYPVNPLSGGPINPPKPPGGSGGSGGGGGGSGDGNIPPPPSGWTWNQILLAGLVVGAVVGFASPLGGWIKEKFQGPAQNTASKASSATKNAASHASDKAHQVAHDAKAAGKAAADKVTGHKSTGEKIADAGKAAGDQLKHAGQVTGEVAKEAFVEKPKELAHKTDEHVIQPAKAKVSSGAGSAAAAGQGVASEATPSGKATGKATGEAVKEAFVEKPKELGHKADESVIRPAKAKGSDALSAIGRALHIVPEEKSKAEQAAEKAKKVGGDVKDWANEKEWYKRWQVYAWSGVALGLGAWGAAVLIQDQVNKNRKPGGGSGTKSSGTKASTTTTTTTTPKDVKVTTTKAPTTTTSTPAAPPAAH